MKAHILYKNYLNPDGNGKSVGGIQTYISFLIPVLVRNGYTVFVHQLSECDFSVQTENATVFGYAFKGGYHQQARFLYDHAVKHIDAENDLVVFGNEALVVSNRFQKSIAIQHGIFWDKPARPGCSKLVYFADYTLQCIDSWKTITRIKKVKTLVCVDYNFLNWYRALVAHQQVSTVVIPNFSQIPEVAPEKDFDGKLNIIFARRFFDYRGTRLFADTLARILPEYEDITVTVAGSGPDEEYLRNKLGPFGNVQFIRYRNDESLAIHCDKHIAIVPTLGSEGTSLSLLEAMASRCAVICTNVGGMTNIVIDNYNGLMIQPDENELYSALVSLLADRQKTKHLADTAFAVTSAAFSLSSWESKWENVIRNTENANRSYDR